MKVILCLCACIAATSAGFIGYPFAPVTYHSSYVVGQPIATFSRPLGVTYTHTLPLAPTYYSYNVIPGNVFLTGVPGVVQYLPVVPTTGKGKPNKKMPGKKDDKDKKEETTEEPKKEEEGKGDEAEDLAE